MAGVVASAFVHAAIGQSKLPNDFGRRYTKLLERVAAERPRLVRNARIVTLAGNARPWVDTGLSVGAGDHVSLFATGKIYLNRAADLFLLPRIALWGRVGHTTVFRPGSDTYSFRSSSAGPLKIATLQGRWATRSGEHPKPDAYDRIEGEIDILVVQWADVTAQEGITRMVALAPDEPLMSAELVRLQTQVREPTAFEPLWFVGSGGSFSAQEFDGRPGVAIRSEQNGGIIKMPLDLSLEPGTTLEWDWRVNQLPALRAENAAPFHQYFSVALEFDDGQDLSWYWSSALDAGRHYRCPFPTWPGETHLVVRSGASELGQWVSERRDVAADVTTALQQTPRRITGLWLIATTVFGQQPASVDLRNITLTDSAGNRRSLLTA